MASKRIILHVGVFLILGALVTAGIAWAAAAWHYVGHAARGTDVTALGHGDVWVSRASYRSRVALRVNSYWGSAEPPPGETPSTLTNELEHAWAPIVGPDSTDELEPVGVRAFDARGWPMLCMWSALEFEMVPFAYPGSRDMMVPGKVTRVIRGMEAGRYRQHTTAAPQHEPRVLPLGIVWSGFVINSMLYATFGLCVFLAGRWSRRAVRVGAGRCPACAYDLRETARDQCPECGLVRLTRSGSAAVRRLRLAVMAAWGAVGVIVAAVFVTSAGPRLAAVNWSVYKPSSWLYWQARREDPAQSATALEVLIERISDGKVSDETIELLVGHALDVQADVTAPWLPQWGDLVVAARTKKLVDDADWETFGRQALVPELLARPTLIPGDLVAATLRLYKRAPSVEGLVAQIHPIDARLGDSLIPMQGSTTTSVRQSKPTRERPTPLTFNDLHFPGTGRWLGYRSNSQPIPADELDPGVRVLKGEWYLTIAEGRMGERGIEYSNDDVLVDGEFALQATVEVLCAEEETVESVRDDSLRTAMTASLEIRSCRSRTNYHSARITGWFAVDSPPMDFAFDVFLRDGEQEWPAGQIHSESAYPASCMFSAQVPGGTADRVDVVLRSSQSAARKTLGITRIWEGEIVIEDVEVTPAR